MNETDEGRRGERCEPLTDEEIEYEIRRLGTPRPNYRVNVKESFLWRALETARRERAARRTAEEDVLVAVAMVNALNNPDVERSLPTINTLFPRWKRIQERYAAQPTEGK